MSTSTKLTTSTTNTPGQPAWWQEYATSFSAGEAHSFLLYGDVAGYAYEAVSQRRFLQAALAQTRDIVAVYNRAQGIIFPTETMHTLATALLGDVAPPAPVRNDPIAAALGSLGPQSSPSGDPFAAAKRPAEALALLEKLVRSPEGRGKVALIIDYADTVCPPSDKSTMSPDGLNILVQLMTWGIDPAISRQNNPIFLLTTRLADIHEDLRASGAGYKVIELTLPDQVTRLAYLHWYQKQRGAKAIAFSGITLEECARLTAGLNLRHLEDILLLGAKAQGVTHALVKARKDAIIAAEYTEVAEMIDPLVEGFAALGGMDHLIQWAKDELIAPIRDGRAADAPKGVLLVGPPGTGKTFLVRALSREIGFNAVALRAENILGGIVGESEQKLKRFFSFARSLAPVLIFIDELDQSDMSRRGGGSGNPVAANLFNSMLQFMSDETLRGKVITIFASNRPDLIDPALLRFGRMDAIIPVLLPDEAARESIIAAQARTQEIAIEVDALTAIAGTTDKYSAADLAAIIAKARKLTRRTGGRAITVAVARAALLYIRPTMQNADWYTLLAIQACNDAEHLPEQYAQLLTNRQELQSQIKVSEPDSGRAERSL